MSEKMEKNKREITPEVDFIKKKFDKHFLNKFKYVKGWKELPKVFRALFGSGNDDEVAFKEYSKMGEWMLVDSEGKRYLVLIGPNLTKVVDDTDTEVNPSKLERELRLSLFGVNLRDIIQIMKKKREDEENKREKKIVTMSESELLSLIKKVIREQSNELEGWDKLKEGEKINLKNDRDGTMSTWIVSATSPNPSKSGGGVKLFLFPIDEGAKKLSPSEIEVSFYPKEMKIDLPGGMNSIVKDAIVKKTPTKPLPIKPDPNRPRIIKKDLDKQGFYSLYHSGKTWETGPNALSGFHISRKGLSVGVVGGMEGKNRFCVINGKTPDGLNIVLKYYCNQQGKLFLIQVGNQKLKLDVENINLTNDITDFGCICPQG